MNLSITNNTNNKKISAFKGGEIYVIIVCIIHCLMLFFKWNYFLNPTLILFYILGIISFVLIITYFGEHFKQIKWVPIVRLILLALAVYMVYLNTQNLLSIVNPHIYDDILIKWDIAIFGKDPTQYFDPIRNPLLTEIMQLTYVSFYFLPMIHGVILYRDNKNWELNELYNQIIFGFLLSYLLYFIMPAIGPRFTLFDFATLDSEMPGILFTDAARAFVNVGGGVPPGTINPAEIVSRDCMPSGHTMLTLINMLLVYKYKTKFKWFFYLVGGCLILSTLYLRYHYGIDVIAGIIFAIISIYIEPKFRNILIKSKLINNSIL